MAAVPDDFILSPGQAAELAMARSVDADAVLSELSQLSAVPSREERTPGLLDVQQLAPPTETASNRAISVSSGITGGSYTRWSARPIRQTMSRSSAQRGRAMTPVRAEDFSRRQEIWAAKRKLRLEEQRSEHARKSEREAVFRPQVSQNKYSEQIAQRRRAPVFERLTEPPPPGPTPAQEAAIRWRERQQELDERECTFVPDTAVSRSSFEMVKSKGQMKSCVIEDSETDAKAAARKQRPLPTGESEGMFFPRTNAVATDMINAHAYLALPVFERLSKPFDEDLLPAESSHTVNESALTRDEADATQLRFLRRQNEREQLRQERMRRIASEHTVEETRQPQLCPRSRSIAKRAAKAKAAPPAPSATRDSADFIREFANLQVRLARDAPGSQLDASARADVLALRGSPRSPGDRRSASPARKRSPRPARGFAALSQQDWQARQNKIEQLRQRLQREYTFQPEMRTKPARVGRTRPLEEDFIERCRSEMTQREDRLALQQAEAAEKAMEECTFHPNNGQGARPLPVFIQRIAEMHRQAVRTREAEPRYAAAR